jgi:hypothetical protein
MPEIPEPCPAFRIVSNSWEVTDSGTFMMFEFSNNGSQPLLLPGLEGLPPIESILDPHGTVYEFYDSGKWTTLETGYCGLTEHYSIAPMTKILLRVHMGPFESPNFSKNTLLRIRLDDFISEPFAFGDTVNTELWEVRKKGNVKMQNLISGSNTDLAPGLFVVD